MRPSAEAVAGERPCGFAPDWVDWQGQGMAGDGGQGRLRAAMTPSASTLAQHVERGGSRQAPLAALHPMLAQLDRTGAALPSGSTPKCQVQGKGAVLLPPPSPSGDSRCWPPCAARCRHGEC